VNQASQLATDVDDDLFERVVTFRRDLHRHPELSNQESRTAARIVEHLERLGLEHRSGVGGHGVVATVPGQRDGPAVALRGDMDALPIFEETGLPFASEVEGVMHACGHDGHTAILLGAAELLLADPPPRPVRLIWQPAEEVATGAERMIEEGALDGFAAIFGGHLDRHYPPGAIVVSDGAVNASTDLFTISISGREGHGARPHEALDAVVVGSLLVTSLQTIVSREVDPAHPSVVTIGTFNAGTAANVIAGRAQLSGTVRSQDATVRASLHHSIERIARAIGELHGARVEVDMDLRTPPLVNQGPMLEIARVAARSTPGAHLVEKLHTANMGGEDFACYLEHVPGIYVRFGAQVPGRESYPAHSSQFDFDESALAVGASWMARVARNAGARLEETSE
jgi:hippurate hydrolase